MIRINYGSRAEKFAMRPPEKDRPINILEGAVRSGKTWCLHPKALYCCAYNVGGRKLFTGVSKQSVYNNVLTDLFDLVGPRNYRYNRNTGQLRLYGTDWLVIGAKDEGSERYVRGLTVGIALCDELSLMPRSFFQMLLTRMSPEGARLYGTTNPDSPYHWLKTDYLDNADLRAKNLLWSDHFTMADNPNLSPGFLEAQKRLYRGFFHKRFIEGLWVIAEGAIYKDSLVRRPRLRSTRRAHRIARPRRLSAANYRRRLWDHQSDGLSGHLRRRTAILGDSRVLLGLSCRDAAEDRCRVCR